MKTGDIILCKRNTLISKLIRLWTKSDYSHTAMYINIWDQAYIIDAQIDGVNVRPFDKWLEDYKYDYVIFRNPNIDDYKSLSIKAMTKVGNTAYDFISLLFKQPFKIIFKKWNKSKNPEDKMYCSEFVMWVHNVNESYKMSPQDVYIYSKENFIEINEDNKKL